VFDKRQRGVIDAVHFQKPEELEMKKVLLIGIAVAAVACARKAGGGGGGGGGGGMADAPNMVTPISVHDLRMNPPATGTPIALRGVVVTAEVSSSKYGQVWVQDQGGGEYSGIHIFCNYGGKSPNCSMTKAQIDAFTPGMVVNIDGKYDPYKPSMPAGANTQLEISSPTITATGANSAPVAMDVTAATVAKDQFNSSSATPLMGELVHLTGGPYTVASTMAPEFAATCMDMAGMVHPNYYGFDLASGSTTIAVGTGFYNNLTYCIPTMCGFTCSNPVTTQTFTSITGIVEPDANSTANLVFMKISPVSDTQLPHS
jgi:hypothetical protein